MTVGAARLDDLHTIASDAEGRSEDGAERAEDDVMSTATIVRKTVQTIAFVLILGVVAGWLFRDLLVELGSYVFEHFGLRGLFTSIFFIEWVPFPTSYEPLLLLGVSAGVSMFDLFVTAASASVIAALGCYAGGALVDRSTPLGVVIARRYPGLVQWVREHGTKGIAIAAVVPLPFSVFMWIAGIVGLPLERMALVSLLRIPKTAFYLWLIAAGWSLT